MTLTPSTWHLQDTLNEQASSVGVDNYEFQHDSSNESLCLNRTRQLGIRHPFPGWLSSPSIFQLSWALQLDKMKFALPLLSLASAAQALYFFVDASTPKCFFEDLPKDTLVVGHYSAEEWDDRAAAWQQHTGINIYISVDVRFPDHPPSSN